MEKKENSQEELIKLLESLATGYLLVCENYALRAPKSFTKLVDNNEGFIQHFSNAMYFLIKQKKLPDMTHEFLLFARMFGIDLTEKELFDGDK